MEVAFHQRACLFSTCVLNFIFSVVATLGNLLAIRALQKASLIPDNLKKLLLSLAVSDLAVGLFAQFMWGVILALILKMTANERYNVDFLCPAVLLVWYFAVFFLACASFLNIAVISVDRLLAVTVHLRYQELVTSGRVMVALVSLWAISAVAGSIYISLPNNFGSVILVVECVGFFFTSVSYIHLYRVVRYHQKEIKRQLQLTNNQRVTELLRWKKSAFNTLLVYVVLIVCNLPYFCVVMLYKISSSQVALLVPYHVTFFFVFLNSSVNPLIYCWRFREIRHIVKSTVKKIFRINGTLGGNTADFLGSEGNQRGKES